jgi:hypothetical protein
VRAPECDDWNLVVINGQSVLYMWSKQFEICRKVEMSEIQIEFSVEFETPVRNSKLVPKYENPDEIFFI